MSVHRTRVRNDRTCAGDGGVAVGARQLLALALCTARTRTSLAGNAALCHGLRAPVARRNNFPGRPAVVSLLASVPDGGARSALHLACAVLAATDVAMCHAHELQTVGRPEGLRVGAPGRKVKDHVDYHVPVIAQRRPHEHVPLAADLAGHHLQGLHPPPELVEGDPESLGLVAGVSDHREVVLPMKAICGALGSVVQPGLLPQTAETQRCTAKAQRCIVAT